MNGEANLTLREVARVLRRKRTSDVPLRRPGEAEGIGWFRLAGEVLVPAAELLDWQRRVTVKNGMMEEWKNGCRKDNLRSCERKPGHDAPSCAARVT